MDGSEEKFVAMHADCHDRREIATDTSESLTKYLHRLMIHSPQPTHLADICNLAFTVAKISSVNVKYFRLESVWRRTKLH